MHYLPHVRRNYHINFVVRRLKLRTQQAPEAAAHQNSTVPTAPTRREATAEHHSSSRCSVSRCGSTYHMPQPRINPRHSLACLTIYSSTAPMLWRQIPNSHTAQCTNVAQNCLRFATRRPLILHCIGSVNSDTVSLPTYVCTMQDHSVDHRPPRQLSRAAKQRHTSAMQWTLTRLTKCTT